MSVPSIPPSSPVKWGASVLAALKNALNAAGGLVGYSGNVGAATGASLALGGATLGTNVIAVTGAWEYRVTASVVFSSLAGDGVYTRFATAAYYFSVYDSSVNALVGGSTGRQAYIGNAWIGMYGSGKIGFSATDPGGDLDAYITRDAAGILAQRNSANAQSLLVYNTWSSAGVNYERGVFDWKTTANVLTIGTEMGGTGIARNLQFKIGNVVKLDYGVTTASTWTFVGTISAATHRHPAAATFPASPVAGDIASVNTATAPTIGSAVALGGAAFALGVYNGAQWTCIGT